MRGTAAVPQTHGEHCSGPLLPLFPHLPVFIMNGNRIMNISNLLMEIYMLIFIYIKVNIDTDFKVKHKSKGQVICSFYNIQ